MFGNTEVPFIRAEWEPPGTTVQQRTYFVSTKPCVYFPPALFHGLSFLLHAPFSLGLDKWDIQLRRLRVLHCVAEWVRAEEN